MLLLKRQLRTCLDLLWPIVQAIVENKQAQQKQNHDVHTKQRDLSVGTPIMAKNFTSTPQWLPGVVIECVASLTYSMQLQDSRIWRRHIDHIVVTNSNDQGHREVYHRTPMKRVMMIGHIHSCSNSTDTMTHNNPTVALQLTTEDGQHYPTRTRRPPQRLIEQTDM